MGPSKFFNFLLVMALLVLHKRAMAEDDSGGFHGCERDALLALKAEFNSSLLDGNWTGIMCYLNEPPYWLGVQRINGRVTGLILESIGLTGEIKADGLVNLTELVTLSFKNKSTSSSLLNLNYLESLQLQDNLTGPIPAFNQSSLKAFNVSHDNLSGPIPQTKTLQSFGLSSYLDNECLSGPPTPTICETRHDTLKSSNQNSDNKSDGSRFTAIPVVVNVIVLVVILFLFIIYYKK